MKRNSTFPNKSYLALSVAAAITASSGISNLAQAQTQQNDENQLEEIIVTGSRIKRGDFVEPNPVVTLTGDDLRNLGINNMSEAMTTQISQNISNFQPTMTGDLFSLSSSFFVGATLANLRGLNDNANFGSRTLTLINGRRVVSTSNQADVVDMNIIPSNLLQRMDVVTGGASAAYGSGAMAGVVNLMLDTKMEGVNFDADYGVTDEGDGENQHYALSAGTSLFEGKGHILVGGEWQTQDAIRSCADAREWCGEGNALLSNDNAFRFTPDPDAVANPYPQYGDRPANFRASDLRYNQFSSNGTIPLVNSGNATSAYRFTPDGTDVETYELGIRGGAAGPGSTVMGGDGPIRATNSALTSGYERESLFTHFEYELNENLTTYAEVNYAKTEGLNVQWPTQGWSCVRFDSPGASGVPGANVAAGTNIGSGAPSENRHPLWSDPNFFAFDFATFTISGWSTIPGNFNFGTSTLLQDYNAPDIPPVLPGRGPDENAYLSTLSPEALEQLQLAATVNNNGNPGNMGGFSGNSAQQKFPCTGHAGVYKLWAPQLVQRTETETDTSRVVLGIKGKLGETWDWDLYYQYGLTQSESLQHNAQTNWRYMFATDSIIDPRVGSATYGQPVCRVAVEGAPTQDANGNPLSYDLSPLAEGCAPLNPFGTETASAESLGYAFRPLLSEGETSLNVLSVNTSGQLSDGWGAGPLYLALGAEVRQDKVDNAGSQGDPLERADFPFPWADAFGGKTTVFEEYAELDVPLLRDLPFIKFLSINGIVRHARYENEGGAGTTGESGTQSVTNWKVSLIWEPLDWLRFRATQSRDLRAATYRELYINQSSVADANTSTNLWRDKANEDDNQTQNDLSSGNTIGNPDLKPETSDTFTAGFVISPGGWAEGMHFSADYHQIDVKDGLALALENPVASCWEASGNSEPEYYDHDGLPSTPNIPMPGTGVNGRYDSANKYCQRVHFGAADPSNPSNQYSNIVATDSTYTNNNPFQIRGIDIAWDYSFPMANFFDGVPGGVALRLTGTHSLEASATTDDFFADGGTRYYDLSGQLGNGVGITFGLPVQPTPEWAGNISMSYFVGPTAVTLSGRYVGEGKVDVIYPAAGPGEAGYQNDQGEFLAGSIDDNDIPSYMNWSLNASYNLNIAGMEQFQIWGQVNNLFDKDPHFTGGYVGGTNPMFYDTLGRSFKLGIRTRF